MCEALLPLLSARWSPTPSPRASGRLRLSDPTSGPGGRFQLLVAAHAALEVQAKQPAGDHLQAGHGKGKHSSPYLGFACGDGQ